MHLVCVGGSDAGISAALRAREVDAGVEVTAVLTDAYPNFSICGIPYYLSGEVGEWRDLAHRSSAELEKAGVKLVTDTTATAIDVAERRLHVRASDGREDSIGYDALVIGTGAVPVRPPLPGLDALGPDDGVHVLHTIGDSRVLADHLARRQPGSALIVGGGYIGLEMAEALTTRGIAVTQAEMRSQVLPTVDPALAALIADELVSHDVDVRTSVTITGIDRAPYEAAGRLRVTGTDGFTLDVDLVLVVVGVRPDTALAGSAGATLAANGAIAVDRRMATNLPHVWAAGDCVQTHHQLLDTPPIFRWAPPRISRAASQARTPWAGMRTSTAASVRRLSRSSTLSPRAQGYARRRPPKPDSSPPPSRSPPTTTRRTTPEPPPSRSTSPGTQQAGGCSERN